MELPSITVLFRKQASSAITRSSKGVVAVLANDKEIDEGFQYFGDLDEAETALSGGATGILKQIGYAFKGTDRGKVKRVIMYNIAAETVTSAMKTAALKAMEAIDCDYITAQTAVATASELGSWVKTERARGHMVKAVVSNTGSSAPNDEGIINFTTADVQLNGEDATAEDMCFRIAGILAATPMTESATYAVLDDVTTCAALSTSEMKTKVGNGQLLIFRDGEKFRILKAVNSLVTVTEDKFEEMKKIKTVETLDMIQKDLVQSLKDYYIGKLSNSYDNKCVVITAILTYLQGLETDGILESGTSSAEIDLDAQTAYLKEQGVDVSEMSEQEIKEHNTGDSVFISAAIQPIDAMESFTLKINL